MIMKAYFTRANHNYPPLDSRAVPDYEPFGVKDMVDNYSDATRLLYRYSRPYPRPFIITASRSCPFTCTFCIHGHRNIPYRARSIPNIMTELKEMYELYQFNILIILDELFAVNKKRMREFCEAVLAGKAKYGWDFDWMFQTHASARFDIETLRLAKKAGCYLFSYGLESASSTVLKSMNKKTKPEQIIEALRLAEEAGIQFSGNLIFGDPAETPETICESIAFYAKYCERAMVFTSFVMPYPGSKLFDDLIIKGVIKDKVAYYESLSTDQIYNMTTIPNHVYSSWMSLVRYLDSSWCWVRTTKATSIVEDTETTKITEWSKQKIYQVRTLCPYCGAENLYRNAFPPFQLDNIPQGTFLGVGCNSCQRKIKVLL